MIVALNFKDFLSLLNPIADCSYNTMLTVILIEYVICLILLEYINLVTKCYELKTLKCICANYKIIKILTL